MLLNLLKNNVSKSLLYILFFAGILKLSGMALTWFWNSYLVQNLDVEHVTFLESVGMIAFFYLVFSGVKFGFNTITAQFSNTDNHTSAASKCQNCELMQQSRYKSTYANKLSADEKERLKQAIAKCCGFPHEAVKIDNKLQIKLHQINQDQ